MSTDVASTEASLNDVMLTTNDNPYNPFDQFEQWLLYDKEMGYNTCERLMRVAAPKLFDGMSQKEEDAAIDQAMDDLIEVDVLNVFVKGTRESIQKMIDSNKSNKNSPETEKETEENMEEEKEMDQ